MKPITVIIEGHEFTLDIGPIDVQEPRAIVVNRTTRTLHASEAVTLADLRNVAAKLRAAARAAEAGREPRS